VTSSLKKTRDIYWDPQFGTMPAEDTQLLIECPNQPRQSALSPFKSTDHPHSSPCFPLPILPCRSPTYEDLPFLASVSSPILL